MYFGQTVFGHFVFIQMEFIDLWENDGESVFSILLFSLHFTFDSWSSYPSGPSSHSDGLQKGAYSHFFLPSLKEQNFPKPIYVQASKLF